MTGGIRVHRQPARTGGMLAILAGAVAIAAAADERGQLVALAGTLVGLLALVIGVGRLRAGATAVGIPLALAGVFCVPAAIGYGAVSTPRMTGAVELVPGLVGLVVLALGVLPVRTAWSRRLVAVGVTAVVAGIVASGVLHEIGRLRLLVAIALCVVAWDAGEQAVSLGEQVGRRGTTAPVVLAHSAWSIGVSGIGVAVATGIDAIDVSGLSLVGLGLVLAAAVVLATAAFT